MEAALFEHACDGRHGCARNSEEMDVFGVRFSASQVCCSSKDRVKSARSMPAVENQNQTRVTMPSQLRASRRATNPVKIAGNMLVLRKSTRKSRLQNFELSFAIRR